MGPGAGTCSKLTDRFNVTAVSVLSKAKQPPLKEGAHPIVMGSLGQLENIQWDIDERKTRVAGFIKLATEELK